MTTRAVIAAAMSEADLQDAVIASAKIYGWRVAHFRPARTASGWRTAVEGHAGFPDLVLANGKRVIVAELKSMKGKPSDDQKQWLAALEPLSPVVWTPREWLDGSIEEELRP